MTLVAISAIVVAAVFLRVSMTRSVEVRVTRALLQQAREGRWVR